MSASQGPFRNVPERLFAGNPDQLFSAETMNGRIEDFVGNPEDWVSRQVGLRRFAKRHFGETTDGFLHGQTVWRLGRWQMATCGLSADEEILFMDLATQDAALDVLPHLLKRWWWYQERKQGYLNCVDLLAMYQNCLSCDLGKYGWRPRPGEAYTVALNHFKARCLDSWFDQLSDVLFEQPASKRWH